MAKYFVTGATGFIAVASRASWSLPAMTSWRSPAIRKARATWSRSVSMSVAETSRIRIRCAA